MMYAKALRAQVEQQGIGKVFFVFDQRDQRQVVQHAVFSCNLLMIRGSCSVTVVPRPSP